MFEYHQIIGVNAHQQNSSKLDALRGYIRTGEFHRIVVIGDYGEDMQLSQTSVKLPIFTGTLVEDMKIPRVPIIL